MASHNTLYGDALGTPNQSAPDLSSLRSSLVTDIKGPFNGETSAFDHFVELNMCLFNKISDLESNYKLSLVALQANKERIGHLSCEVDSLKHENDLLTFKLALVDDSTRSSNLRIEGLLEANNKVIKESVAACLSKSGVTCQVEDIDYAKCMGRYREGQTHPVMVRLLKEGLRNAILINRTNVSRGSNPPVWVNDDVSRLLVNKEKG